MVYTLMYKQTYKVHLMRLIVDCSCVSNESEPSDRLWIGCFSIDWVIIHKSLCTDVPTTFDGHLTMVWTKSYCVKDIRWWIPKEQRSSEKRKRSMKSISYFILMYMFIVYLYKNGLFHKDILLRKIILWKSFFFLCHSGWHVLWHVVPLGTKRMIW